MIPEKYGLIKAYFSWGPWWHWGGYAGASLGWVCLDSYDNFFSSFWEAMSS